MDKLIKWFKFSNPFKRIPCLLGFHQSKVLYTNGRNPRPYIKLECLNIYCPFFNKQTKI